MCLAAAALRCHINVVFPNADVTLQQTAEIENYFFGFLFNFKPHLF